MREILLTNGLITLVDDEDFENLNKYSWSGIYKKAAGKAKYYVSRNSGKGKTEHMHRTIMNCPKGMVVDHINDDPLDNRKENLRVCTHKENTRNQKRSHIGVSGYKGVHKSSSKGKWSAKVNYTDANGVYHTLRKGVFATPEEAAIAYNELAKIAHGEYANLNIL